MKVLFNALSVSPTGAGISRYASSLVHHMLAMPERAQSLRVALQDTMSPLGSGASDTLKLGDMKGTFARILAEQVRLLPAVYLADVVHYADFAPPLLAAQRTIVTIHDLAVIRFPQYYTPGQRAWKTQMLKVAAKKARHLICISEFTKRELCEYFSIAPERVSMVHNGFEPSKIQLGTLPDAIRPPYILYVGTLAPQKNLVRLVRAFGLLKQRHKLPHSLVIAGKLGWMADELFNEVRGAGLSDAVILTGYVSEPDLQACYRNAHAVAYVSMYEGFGLPPLEAMSAGVPVVASNAAAIPEVVGDAAVLVDPYGEEAIAEGLLAAITDESLRERLIAAGYKQLRKFSWSQCANETWATYERVFRGELNK